MPEVLDSKEIQPFRSRIAPTPSGFLHKGNGFSFVLSWLLVRSFEGKLLLRIDDADTSRARPEYLEDIFHCLDWLGLDWDEGPAGPDDFQKNYTQQLRFGNYESLLEVLVQKQQLYACSCSRSQIRRRNAKGVYGGSCRKKGLPLEKGIPWRMLVPEEVVPCFKEWPFGERCLGLAAKMGDFVVMRREGLPAYQVASLADDIAWGTTLVVRGEDLLDSTAAQVFLAGLLATQHQNQYWQTGGAAFQQAKFLHHPLLKDEKGEKLSKSTGSTSLKSLREAGGTPLAVYALVAEYLDLPADAAASLPELLQAAKEKLI